MGKARKNYPKYEIMCDLCGRIFACARPDARFCSVKCKQADYRIRKAAEVLAAEHVSADEVKRLQRLAAQAKK